MNLSKLLIIGAGAIARKHAEAARKLNPPPALKVADPNQTTRESFAQEFPEAELFTSMEELLAPIPEKNEVVIIATPPWLHSTQTIAALKSGRHVLCEKPLAINPTEARLMADLAATLGLHLHCCSSRFSSRPITREVRKRLSQLGNSLRIRWQVRTSNGRPGIEYQPNSRWFLDRSKAGGGVLMDWGCYDLAVLSEVFQPVAITIDTAWIGAPQQGLPLPENVKCDVEHQATATLRFHLRNGSTIPLAYERSSAAYGATGNVMQIEGERGALEWDWIDWNGSSIRHFHETEAGKPILNEDQIADDGLSCHDRPLHSLAALLEGKPASCISGRYAASLLDTLHAIYRTATTQTPNTIHLHS